MADRRWQPGSPQAKLLRQVLDSNNAALNSKLGAISKAEAQQGPVPRLLVALNGGAVKDYTILGNLVQDQATGKSRAQTLDEALDQLYGNTSARVSVPREQARAHLQAQLPQGADLDAAYEAWNKVGSTSYAQRFGAGEDVMAALMEMSKQPGALEGLGFAPQVDPALQLKAKQELAAAIASKDPAVRQAALEGLGEAGAALRQQLARQIPAEADNWWSASIPFLDNVSRGQAALGLGSAAVGAGGLALAQHLMAIGQQQRDPVAYAAAVQAQNAY